MKSKLEYFLLRLEDYLELKKQKLIDIKTFSGLQSNNYNHPSFDFGDLLFYPHHSNTLKGFKENIIPIPKIRASEFQISGLIKDLALRGNHHVY